MAITKDNGHYSGNKLYFCLRPGNSQARPVCMENQELVNSSRATEETITQHKPYISSLQADNGNQPVIISLLGNPNKTEKI